MACVVPFCPSHPLKRDKKTSFHRFPANASLRETWLSAISRGLDWQPSSYSRICSRHFGDGDFDRTHPTRIRLKPDAVPFRRLKQSLGNEAVHFDDLQFENHRQDNKRKLKQNAVPTLFDLPLQSCGTAERRADPEGLQRDTKAPVDEPSSSEEEVTGATLFDLSPEDACPSSAHSQKKVDYAKLQSMFRKRMKEKKMAPKDDDSDILNKIQGTYVPFLKKLIAFLDKNKKATPENLTKLKAIYTIFTTANSREQIETFHANQKKLENWYNKAQKEKHSEDGDVTKGSKRPFTCSDTESSQGACDTTHPSSKKSCTFTNTVDSDSSQPAILKVQSINQHSTKSPAGTNLPVDVSQIKKEKTDTQKISHQPIRAGNSQTPVISKPPEPDPTPPADEPIVFTCASCQFQTREETEFMKHARTDHRTDLSMWCKQCGKCFSNAGVLVSHIKERACIKEEMIYKCGVKDCIFETTSGQTFVHHLRHCHKGSPFIFCVHCQKIFTLPHCLILHMQDDCPFKDRNRRNPGSTPVHSATPTPATKTDQPKITTVSMSHITNVQGQTVAVRAIAPRPTPVVQTPTVRTSLPIVGISRGRGRSGRGRGRGRGRARISDSSDSDDPDDPSWRPEESLAETGLRRSGRWAKKINDVMNPEPSTSGASTSSAKKSFTSDELNSKMINCPCCDFMAAFQSVLEDHYIANHKVPNKNSCLVCHLKFENTRSFLEHFEEHRKGSLPNGPPPALLNEITPQATSVQAVVPSTLSAVTVPVSTSVTLESESIQTCNASSELEPFDGVLTSIADAKLMDPAACKDKAVKIPYQAAIHDKNLKDSKLRKFEELKSPSDLITMKKIQKLQHYFKCALYTCSFTTDLLNEFTNHLKTMHEGKRYHCCYCFKEELSSNILAKHIVFKHNQRIYQCSKCFYRACSKAHLQIHIKNAHSQDVYTDILVCDAVKPPDNVTFEEESTSENTNTTWPYICAIGPCDFSTYSPKEFKKHNEMVHRTVSVYYCYYCKVDFLTFKRLMNHYRLHGLNLFQCYYCIHGAETKEEILLHLCNVHADQPLKAYMRGSQEEASSEVKQLNNVVCETSNGTDFPNLYSLKNDTSTQNVPKVFEVEKKYTGYEDKLYHVIENVCYPAHMRSLCYPRYLKNLLSDVICGIPFCNEKYQSIDLYASHLRNDHDALNFPCPYCPEMCNTWEDFQDHLLCHASKLYACGVEDCEYYDWNKDRVKEHKKRHEGVENGPIAIREFASLEEENKVHALTLSIKFPAVKDPYVCVFCKYKSSDQTIMKNHMYREMAYQRFDCSLCEKKCLSRKDIKNHFIVSHPDLDIMCLADYNVEIETTVRSVLIQRQKFENIKLAESCDMCCKKFRNSLRLQSHLYMCLQKEYRPYECDHCKICFASPLVLKYHIDEEHDSKPLKFSVLSSYAVEDDIEKNLLKVRLKQLKDIFEENKLNIDVDEKAFKVKFYTCSECSYEAHHKYNVQRHSKLKHDGVAKVMKGIERNVNSESLSSQLDENSNDTVNIVKRFGCGYCVKKMITLHEVEMHVKKAHTVKNDEYFYYYSPDVSMQFSASDKEIYECAYCKSTRENLFSLKKHADLMHSEMEFKVKGFVSNHESQKKYLACGYCYLKVSSPAELHAHSTSSHPLLALKSFGDFQTSRNKHSLDSSDDIPNKRVKFNCTVYVCSHCGGAFANEEQITIHSKKAHSRISLEYTKMEQPSNSYDSADFRFYKCEFCKFTSEKQYLDKHLASKHKMRVTCSYCNKRFEFASRLKEHHDVVHKDLPLKYSQETVSVSITASSDSNSASNDRSDAVKVEEKPGYVSHYGKNPEPVDLSSITVHMETKEGQSANLPLVYVTERFNLFPKVVVKDVMKGGNKDQ